MELHGVTGAPYKHPQVRRTVPAFNRARIDLDGGTRVKRSWKDVSVLEIVADDTVAGFGVVASKQQFVNIPDSDSIADGYEWRVRLYNVLGEHRDYRGEQRLFTFSKDT